MPSIFMSGFVNMSVYILSKILTTLQNLFYINSFIFVDVNVDLENPMHSDFIICNNFINCKVLPALDFRFIGLE